MVLPANVLIKNKGSLGLSFSCNIICLVACTRHISGFTNVGICMALYS